MTTIKEIESKFPIKVLLTEDMITEGSKNIYNPSICKGALLLRSVLPKEDVTWGCNSGTVRVNYANIIIEAILNDGSTLNVMNALEPKQVILTISGIERY